MSHTVIGLVGGIASGKSTVAAVFQALRPGRYIDADALARRVVARPAIAREILGCFPGAAGEDHSIDRKKLAGIVFSNPQALKSLEDITHPPIRQATERAIARAAGMVYLDAPLLLETGADEACDWIVYVACPARARRRRAVASRGWTEAEHRAREARQWPLRRKRARADFVVDNSGDARRTEDDVRRILRGLGK